MNYIILGAGALGSFYGAMLSKNNDVLLIGRKAHVDSINEKSLTITGKVEGNFKLKAATEITEIPEKTILLLTTKVYDSEKAISDIKDKLKDDTIIVCLQNGYLVEDIVKKIVPNKVLRAVSNQAITFESPGNIRTPFTGFFRIESDPLVMDLVRDLRELGFDAQISDNIQEDVWRKLLINCVINPLTAVLDVPNDGLENERDKMRSILDEIKMVLDAEGIMIPAEEYEEVIDQNLSSNISSMLQDIRNKRKTEINYLNGAVVELGKKHNIPTPVNEELVKKVKEIEDGY